MQYLMNEQAAQNLTQTQRNTNISLEDGILGTQKPIVQNQATPRQRLRIGAKKSERQMADKRDTAVLPAHNTASLPESRNKVNDQLTASSPPETA